jgi:hypothetical protein
VLRYAKIIASNHTLKIHYMKAKITLRLLVFYSLISDSLLLLNTGNRSSCCQQIIASLHQEIALIDQFVSFLKKTWGSIAFILFNVENQRNSMRSSPPPYVLTHVNSTIYNTIFSNDLK